MTRAIVIGAVAVLVVGISLYYLSGKKGAEPKTVLVKRGDLVVVISASGAVEPNFQVEVKSKASGEILEFPFEPGDKVTAGQTLLKLDRRTEQRNLAQREADLAAREAEQKSAEANLLEKEMRLKRAKKLMEQKLVPEQEMESAIASAAVAEARVSEARAAVRKARLIVDDAQERLDETIISSPIDGVIIEKSVERGQIISSGISSFTGGTKLCVVADMSRVFIIALVDETDIGQVSVGMSASVTVDAYPDKVFKGSVIRVFPMGEMRENITVFKVKIEALGEEKLFLKPKMTANVDMILETRENALIVPEEAVRNDGNNDDAPFVFVLEENGPEKRVVKIGLSNGMEIEITDGLEEGEKILLRPPGEKNDSRDSYR